MGNNQFCSWNKANKKKIGLQEETGTKLETSNFLSKTNDIHKTSGKPG